MKKIILFIFLISASLFVFSQSNNDFPLWLKGVWEISSETGSSFEEWKVDKDGSLSGRTYRLFVADTIVFDTMRVKYWEDQIVFQMTANIKNTRVYARYPLQRPDPILWRFENPLTDYPKSINYMQMGTDSVYVWTESSRFDNACMDYVMIRVKK